MKKLLFLSAVLTALATAAIGASVPYFTGPQTMDVGTLNQLIGSINSNIRGLGFSTGTRNFLDNGDAWVNQRNATATAATTSGCVETSYSADRWCADVNMASGAGQLAVATTPAPPPGFINVQTLVRNSGSLGQPQCAMQELPTLRATQLQGQQADLSVYAEALAGLAADNGNQAQLFLVTGTGAAQGLGGLRSAVGMTTTTKASSMTISTSTGLITNATAVVAGQPVWMTAAAMPGGITSGQAYYVSTALLNSGTAFAVAPTYAQAIAGTGTVVPSSGGTTVVINVPYITPVWTGLAVYGPGNAGQGQTSAAQAFGQAFSQPFTLLSAQYTRISTGPIALPTNVTEVAALICFTPLASSSGGSTDGIAFTGAQLEVLPANITTPGDYEFLRPQDQVQATQRYYLQANEPVTGAPVASGVLSSTTACTLDFPFPVPMDTTPVFATIGTLSTSTFRIQDSTTSTLASTFLGAGTANTVNHGQLVATLTTASTAGWACQLQGGGASGSTNGFDFGADF